MGDGRWEMGDGRWEMGHDTQIFLFIKSLCVLCVLCGESNQINCRESNFHDIPLIKLRGELLKHFPAVGLAMRID